jgi:nucleoside-diphosphate-sugar epimerase
MGVVLVGSEGYIGQGFASRLTSSRIDYLQIKNRKMFDSLHEDFWKNIQGNTTIIWAAGQANRNQEILTSDVIRSEIIRFEKFVKEITQLKTSSIRVLFMSSGGAIYKNFTTPPSETGECTENNKYGALKSQMEALLIQNEINHVSLRLGNVYGPKIDKQFGVIANWARCIRDGKKIHITESVRSQRDYIHISDVIDFSLLSMNSTFTGPINVATGISTSLGQIIELFELNRPNVFVDSEGIDRSEITKYSQGALDVGLAGQFFQWSHKILLEDGIREILTDLK